jgi:signal transduction histidine kinase
MVAIIASCLLALGLQRRRVQAESARVDAESARDLGRLLHTLMAHDLRAPLTLARQALDAIQTPLRHGTPVDVALLADVDARLERSLRAIQIVLDSARSELDEPEQLFVPVPIVDVGREIRDEVASFEAEAAGRGKDLRLGLPPDPLRAGVDPAIVRQSLAILIDNALRYADPGPIRIGAAVENGELLVTIGDSGPGLTGRRVAATRSGEGLGLKLCGLMAERAGGALEIARDDETGTEFVLRLPDSG